MGYGDRFPATAGGRAVGAMLMVLGIALFGLLAASVSAVFIRKDVANDVDPQLAEMNARLERIERGMAEIRNLVTDRRIEDSDESSPGDA